MYFLFSIIFILLSKIYCQNSNTNSIGSMINILEELISKGIIISIDRALNKSKLINDTKSIEDLERCKKSYEIFNINEQTEDDIKIRKYFTHLLYYTAPKSQNDIAEYSDCLESITIDLKMVNLTIDERKELRKDLTYTIFRIIEKKNKSISDITFKDNEYLFGFCIKKGCSQNSIKEIFYELNQQIKFFENLEQSNFSVYDLEMMEDYLNMKELIPLFIFILSIIIIHIIFFIIRGQCLCNTEKILGKKEKNEIKILRGLRGLTIFSIVISTSFFYIYHSPTKVFNEENIEELLNDFSFPFVYHGERFGKKILYALSGFELVNAMIYFLNNYYKFDYEEFLNEKNKPIIEKNYESDNLSEENINQPEIKKEEKKLIIIDGNEEEEEDEKEEENKNNKVEMNQLAQKENPSQKSEEEKDIDIFNKDYLSKNKKGFENDDDESIDDEIGEENNLIEKEKEKEEEEIKKSISKDCSYLSNIKKMNKKVLFIWYFKQFYKYILFIIGIYLFKYGTIYLFMFLKSISPIMTIFYFDISQKFTYVHFLSNLFLFSPFSYSTFYWIDPFCLVYNEITFFIIGSFLIYVSYKFCWRLDLILLFSFFILLFAKICISIFIFFKSDFYPAMFYQFENLYVIIKSYLLSNQLMNLNIFLLGMFFGEIYYCVYNQEEEDEPAYLTIPRKLKNKFVNLCYGNPSYCKAIAIYTILFIFIALYLAIICVYEIFIFLFLKNGDKNFFFDKILNIVALVDGDIGIIVFMLILATLFFNSNNIISNFLEHKFWRILSGPYWSNLILLHIISTFVFYYSENKTKLFFPSIIFLGFEIQILLLFASFIFYTLIEFPLKYLNNIIIKSCRADKDK